MRYSLGGKIAAGEFLVDHTDTQKAWDADNYMHYTGMMLRYFLFYIYLVFFLVSWVLCYFTSFISKMMDSGKTRLENLRGQYW